MTDKIIDIFISNGGFDTDMGWINNGNGWKCDNVVESNDTVMFVHPVASFTISNYVAGKISIDGKQIKIEKSD